MPGMNYSYASVSTDDHNPLGHRWIAMLDIAGFRQLVKTRQLSWLMRQLDHLFAAAEPTEASCGFLLGDGRVRKRNLTLGHLHFSDTLMLWTPPLEADDHDVKVAAFSHICNTVANLIALALINGLSLRGGLAFGECYINPAKQLAVGKPIVDAYLLEQEQEWVGAAVSATRFFDPATFDQLEWCSLVRYRVPTKTPLNYELVAIDWTHIARMPDPLTQKLWKINARSAVERALSDGLAAATSAVKRVLSEGLTPDTEERIYRKWQNTAEFFRSQSQRRPLEFIRYKGPNGGWDTVVDKPV
jgi:hypothetical protein